MCRSDPLECKFVKNGISHAEAADFAKFLNLRQHFNEFLIISHNFVHPILKRNYWDFEKSSAKIIMFTMKLFLLWRTVVVNAFWNPIPKRILFFTSGNSGVQDPTLGLAYPFFLSFALLFLLSFPATQEHQFFCLRNLNFLTCFSTF